MREIIYSTHEFQKCTFFRSCLPLDLLKTLEPLYFFPRITPWNTQHFARQHPYLKSFYPLTPLHTHPSHFYTDQSWWKSSSGSSTAWLGTLICWNLDVEQRNLKKKKRKSQRVVLRQLFCVGIIYLTPCLMWNAHQITWRLHINGSYVHACITKRIEP